MAMLSLFPQLLFLAPLASTLIRVALAILLIYEGLRLVSGSDIGRRMFSVVHFALGVALFVGAWTQLAALCAAALWAATYFVRSWTSYPRSTIALAVVMSVALVVSGAGAFAFDLPL
jgi:uncharacterized membrane protein YphA (DoxX/SURF4 family)